MISKNSSDKKVQLQVVSLEQLVPEDHLLRKIDEVIDFSFIYDLVEDKYSTETGRPSIDPVMLIKIPVIQYMFGIKSMRQTIKEIEVNVAYRWFLGLDFYDKVPHFSTFGKNYKRRFEGTDLFEQIFQEILYQCMKHNVIDTSTLFVDATHVKACANRKKAKKILVAKKAARFYDEALKEEIDADRQLHGKKPLPDKDDKNDDDDLDPPSGLSEETKEQKVSTVDPESGWFHKGEHKEVFAYSVESACDRHGWILDYTIHPGNEHDSKTFPTLYEKLRKYNPKKLVMDAGYKTPAIAKLLIDENRIPIFPYTAPKTKAGFLRKKEYAYDEYYDCYICPNNHILEYSTTNRDGYREYKSKGQICESCPYLSQCTQSKNHVKLITRHVWYDYMEICEDIRCTDGIKAEYDLRKQTIERIFGTAKEHHAMRYTQQIGKEKMQMKIGLTFACLNMKKLVKVLGKRVENHPLSSTFLSIFEHIKEIIVLPRINYSII
ncbi:MAG TPA: IS1182 family transposase [Anaerovoracaceae bacterium]|nr:IS1182 family transposase [Anaerovoracaceae bacterium]